MVQSKPVSKLKPEQIKVLERLLAGETVTIQRFGTLVASGRSAERRTVGFSCRMIQPGG
jgi:hypothetical protein